MKKIIGILKTIGFVLLILLACTGIALPIPMFWEARTYKREDLQEQIDEKEEKESEEFEL